MKEWQWRFLFYNALMHWTVCSQTRYGKSELARARLIEIFKRRRLRAGGRNVSAVVVDPPGSLVSKLLLDLDALGRTKDVLLIRFCDLRRTVGLDWLAPSTAADPLTRQKENEDARDRFKRKLLFRRGMTDTSKTPRIEEFLNLAIELLLYQDQPCPAYWVLQAFEPFSDEQAYLLAHCTRPDIVRQVAALNEMHPSRRRDECSPAVRILQAFLGKALILAHTGATFDFGAWLDRGGIILVDGSGTDDDAANVMAMSIIQMAFDHCWKGSQTDVLVVIDEATRLTDLSVAEQMRTIAKRGAEIWLLFQNPLDFATDQIRNEVFGNSYHAWGRLPNPKAAQLAGDDVGIRTLDKMKEHHRDRRTVQRHDGYDVEKRKSTSISRNVPAPGAHEEIRSTENEGEQLVARYRTDVEETVHFDSYDSQLKDVTKELMTLDPGWFFFVGQTVTPKAVYQPLVREQWGFLPALADSKRQKVIDTIQSRPEYRTPTLEAPCNETEESDAESPLDDLAD